jgi:hypothetical protein
MDIVSYSGLQTRADAEGKFLAGGDEQYPGKPAGHGGLRGTRCGAVRAGIDRQGGAAHQRDGGQQEGMRSDHADYGRLS